MTGRFGVQNVTPARPWIQRWRDRWTPEALRLAGVLLLAAGVFFGTWALASAWSGCIPTHVETVEVRP